MGLDFGNTCPIIDEDMEKLKYDIEYFFESIVDDIKDQLPEDIDIDVDIENYSNALYKEAAIYFEELRTVNSDMRTQAEKQIYKLEEEITYLEDQSQ